MEIPYGGRLARLAQGGALNIITRKGGDLNDMDIAALGNPQSDSKIMRFPPCPNEGKRKRLPTLEEKYKDRQEAFNGF